jgi:hypothetical protein
MTTASTTNTLTPAALAPTPAPPAPAVALPGIAEPAAGAGTPSRIVEGEPGAVEQTLVSLAGKQLLAPGGALLAELDSDGVWRNPAGLVCEALTIPAARASAYVDPKEVTRAARTADRIWREAAVEKIAWLVERQAEITSDDLWEHMEHPPREARLVGHAFKRAQAQGLIDRTGRHQRSRRPMNHTRPVLIWRSLHPAHI